MRRQRLERLVRVQRHVRRRAALPQTLSAQPDDDGGDVRRRAHAERELHRRRERVRGARRRLRRHRLVRLVAVQRQLRKRRQGETQVRTAPVKSLQLHWALFYVSGL